MKNKTSVIFSICLLGSFLIGALLLSSCKKEKKVTGCMDKYANNYNSSATEDDRSCQYIDKLTFCYNSPQPQATVTINGQTGYISTYYGYTSGCDLNGCANFTLPRGTYTYTASNGVKTWSGTKTTVTECEVVLLK